MAPRHASQQSRASFHPPNDPATYRDVLLFEERLKTNAATLQRRKSRYQCKQHGVYCPGAPLTDPQYS